MVAGIHFEVETPVSKDKRGKIIGFEKLYVEFPKGKSLKNLPVVSV